MRYVKILVLISVLCVASESVGATNELNACIEQGKSEFAAQNYAQAKHTFTRCLTLDEQNEEVLLSLGGVCLTQEELPQAREYFLAALKQMKRTSPYLSYTYSMLGDIALKQKQNKTALEYYNRSLSFNQAYTNSLVGKGIITEELGDKKAAAEVYKTALAVEPLNVVARERLTALEPVYFSNEEMLEALKQRYAVKPDQENLTEEDRTLFLQIHSAEQQGALDYLKEKYKKVPADYTTTLFEGSSISREVLTLAGYEAARKGQAQDAIVLFEKSGISVKDIFELRDLKGQKIFLPDSTLTDSGVEIYKEALKGKRMFLLPSEDVPLTQAERQKLAARINGLNQRGYMEISRKELEMLKSETNCKEEVLRQSLGLYVLQISKHRRRYFVLSNATDAHKGLAWYYVATERAKRNPSIKVPSNKLASSYKSIDFTVCSAIDGQLLE